MPALSQSDRAYATDCILNRGSSDTMIWIEREGIRTGNYHTTNPGHTDETIYTVHATREEALAAALDAYEAIDAQCRTNDNATLRYIGNTGYGRTVFDRPVLAGGLPSPCTFAGSFKRQLRQWSEAGCAVSKMLQNPDNHHNAEIDYIAARAGMLSFLPKGKPHQINEDGTWSRQGRQEGKPGRIVQRILTPEARAQLTDKDLALFGDNTRGAGLLDSGVIHIVSGPEIAKWYRGYTYAPGDTPLQNSCMRHNHCASYFGLYTDNPDRCQMAIMLDTDERLIGRALVWKTDDGDTYLDRIYGQDDVIQAFKAYASEQGWYSRYTQTYDNKMLIVDPSGEMASMVMRVSLDTAHGTYPYVDTFTYLASDEGYITNDAGDENVTDELISLYGETRTITRRSCCHCDDRLTGHDNTYHDGDWYCDDCFTDLFTSCDRCGSTVDNDEAIRTPNDSYYCESCFARVCFHCADCGEAEYNSHGGTNAAEQAVCRDCTENYTYCEDCNTTVHTDDYDFDAGCCNECQIARVEAAQEAETEAHNDPDPIVTTEDVDAMFDRVGVPAPEHATMADQFNASRETEHAREEAHAQERADLFIENPFYITSSGTNSATHTYIVTTRLA